MSVSKNQIAASLLDILEDVEKKNVQDPNRSASEVRKQYADAMADWFLESFEKAVITVPIGTPISTSAGPGTITAETICKITFP